MIQSDPNKTPLVSIIIPAYNAELYIKKAINSLLNQSYQNFKIIVINDGSMDSTEAVVNQFSDARIGIISQANGGMSSARNAGLRAATGQFIAFLDSDDYWLPEKLEKQVVLLQDNPDIGFCSTQTRVETPDGKFVNNWLCPVISISTVHTIMSESASIAGSASSVLARKSVQEKAGFFDESLTGLEDTDMWIRFAAISNYCCIPETLTVILKRPNSVSRSLTNMRNSGLEVLQKNRHLLDKKSQKQFWRSAYASMLCDYAKWEARSGLKVRAIMHLLEALVYAPFKCGRLSLSLIYAITFNRPLA
ncbi:MAG: glycosyltransferase family A protein [Methyloprofundus sp.]|nr:glycosyltransferase family A protein [Methyloprofundus sp.]